VQDKQIAFKITNYIAGYGEGLFRIGSENLEVSAGEIIAIKGSNGSGKSTFIKGLLGLTPIRTGEILCFGNDISSLPFEKLSSISKIGYLPQDNKMFPQLTVEEHLRLLININHKGKKEPTRFLRDSVYFPLEMNKGKIASTLSGGERLLLSLACLEIFDSDILLLDEPFAGADQLLKKRIIMMIENWRSKGKAIVLIEHDLQTLHTIDANIYEIMDREQIEMQENLTNSAEYIVCPSFCKK